MELKEGYKKTEVGVIPEDWEIFPLGELFSFSGGYTASRDQLLGDGFCYLHYGDIHKSNKTYINVKNEYQEIPKLNVPIKMVSQKSLLNDGDVVFVDASEDDEGASKHIVVQNQDETTYISGLHTIVSKSKNDYVYNSYKQHCFQTADVKRQFKFYAVGTKVSGISKANIAKIQIPLPPTKAEQTAIATALSDADDLIQSLEKLIAKKRNIKQGAMQELLKPQEGWVVKKLGEAAFFSNGKAHEQFIDEAGNYIVVNSKLISTEGKVFKNVSVSLCPLNAGDITMVMSDIPNGKALAKCFIIPKSGKYTLNQRICALRSELVDNNFLAYIINRNKYFLAFDSGTGQTNLKKKEVLDCPIPLPPTSQEQTRIATILSDIDAEIAALETKLAKYKQVKQGMMQELLTGRTRLV